MNRLMQIFQWIGWPGSQSRSEHFKARELSSFLMDSHFGSLTDLSLGLSVNSNRFFLCTCAVLKDFCWTRWTSTSHIMHSGFDWSSLPLKSLQDDTAYCHLIKEWGYVLKSIQHLKLRTYFLHPIFNFMRWYSYNALYSTLECTC